MVQNTFSDFFTYVSIFKVFITAKSIYFFQVSWFLNCFFLYFKEEQIAGKDNLYESKINSLLDEVGVLRNEVFYTALLSSCDKFYANVM